MSESKKGVAYRLPLGLIDRLDRASRWLRRKVDPDKYTKTEIVAAALDKHLSGLEKRHQKGTKFPAIPKAKQ